MVALGAEERARTYGIGSWALGHCMRCMRRIELSRSPQPCQRAQRGLQMMLPSCPCTSSRPARFGVHESKALGRVLGVDHHRRRHAAVLPAPRALGRLPPDAPDVRPGGREWLGMLLSRFGPVREKAQTTAVLEFEKPLIELDKRIKEVCHIQCQLHIMTRRAMSTLTRPTIPYHAHLCLAVG